MEIPVYVFTGFLDSGKTRFIQETLEDDRFNSGEPTLMLLLEDGEEEFDFSRFPKGSRVFTEVVLFKENLTPKYLEALRKKHKAQRVLIECNGMWKLEEIYSAFPKDWVPAQEISIADSTIILGLNTNLRSLVVDKLSTCEMIVFNRVSENTDKMALHKLVRGVSRRTDIMYEYLDGSVEFDDIEDPLPFDVSADEIVIEDRDYALWYRDLSENMLQYDGKIISFKGIVAVNKKINGDSFVAGRHVMTCCADDITYCGVICKMSGSEDFMPETSDWVELTARLSVEYHEVYKQKGPVLKLIKLKKTDAPEEKVATFY